MATFEEDLASFKAIEPRSADTSDIERGRRLLDQMHSDDSLHRMSLLAKLGSFYLENKELDIWECLEKAKDCYEETLSLAQELENGRWTLVGFSGCTNVLVRRYELGRDPRDLDNADRAFRELIDICDRLGHHEDSLSNRTNYALMLTRAFHGDRYSNLDKAIELLRQVTHSYSQEVSGTSFDPFQYGRALYNLAVALLKQSEEPHIRTLNINEAIDLLQKALLYRTADVDPPGRISALRALAQVLPDWEGASSLAHAEELADEASSEADSLALAGHIPHMAEWALAAQKKSALFWDIDQLAASRASLKMAIVDHSVNIDRIPRDQLPFLWAEWVGGYALLVGRIGIEDNQPELWQRSKAAFQDALAVVSREQDPKLCLILNREMGRVCHQCADWEGSLAANRNAFEIGDFLVDAAGTNVSRGKELEEVTRANHFAAYAAAELGKSKEAAELAEMGRARWLDQAIQLAVIRTSALPEETKIALDQAQATVLDLERRELELLNSGSGGVLRRLENFLGMPFGDVLKVRQMADPDGAEAKRKQELASVRTQLQKAHLHLTGLLKAIPTDGSATRRLTSAQIQKIALDAGFPIVYLLSTAWGSTAIIVGKEFEILPLPEVVRSTVQGLLYGDNGYVYLCTDAREGDLDDSLGQIKAMADAYIVGPLAVWCHENGVTTIAVVGLGDIGLLPLQVSTVPAGLDLKVLPSARSLILSLAGSHMEGRDVKSLLTVGDPGSDRLPALPFSGIESSLFASLFRSSGATVVDLSKTPTLEVLEQNLSNPSHLHLACHGTFMPFSPLNSVVHLEGSEKLEVESLLRPALKLRRAELVILSACNSAIGEPWRTPDEAVGFPAALLAAGARTVVAAQWEVSDAVTLLIMQHFCRSLLAGASSVAGSLAEAQRWLSTADTAKLVSAIDRILDDLGQEVPRSCRLLREFQDEIRECETLTPFAELSYWAGFISVGA